MTTTSIKLTIFATALFLVFGIFSVAQSVLTDGTFVQVATAQTSCGDCGGGDTGGGGGGGDSSNPPVCDISTSAKFVEPGDSYTISWTGTSGASYALVNDIDSLSVSAPGSYTFVWDANDAMKIFEINGQNSDGTCSDLVEVYRAVDAPICDVSVDVSAVSDGEEFTISWSGTPDHSTVFRINGQIVAANDSQTYNWPAGRTDPVTVTMTGDNAAGQCTDSASITLKGDEVLGCTDPAAENYNPEATEDDGSCEYPEEAPSCDSFTAAPTSLPHGGGNVALAWTTSNVDSVSINQGVGTVAEDGSKTVSVSDTITYTLTASKAGFDDASCPVTVTVLPEPISCAANVTFGANPTTLPVGGGNTTLTWTATGVDTISIDNGILAETNTLSGSDVASVGNDTIYTLTAKRGAETINCPVSITVADPVPQPISCEANASFTANPTSLGVGGGDVTLTWSTTKAGSVKLDGIAVATSDSVLKSITDDTTYTLSVTGDSSTTGNTVECPLTVPVADEQPEEISCAANVSFTASDTSLPSSGGDVTLTWSTTGLDSISINGVASVALSDSETVNVTSDRTYTLTGIKDDQTINCPISLDVATGGGGGGGGGGSSSPRCEFDASDTNISAGQEVTLSWDTRFGRDLTIYEGDEDGEKIFETNDDDQVDEGSIKVRPTKDTLYTLVVERGSRDRDCTVEIDVEGNVVLGAERVAGISLSAVPYTGFDAGPILTLIFYVVLAIWGLFVAYMLVVREDSIMGVSLAGAFPKSKIITDDVSTEGLPDEPEASEAAAYVGSVTAPVQSASVSAVPPVNLPTSTAPIGYAAQAAAIADIANDSEDETSREMKEIEDRAHARKVLLSSDAIRHFISVSGTGEHRLTMLDAIMDIAKVTFPTEDGWVVLNLDRMQSLCDQQMAPVAKEAAAVATEEAKEETRVGASSLAESIVTGNIAAAYQMIGARPMFALADAAADLDALYRGRKGEQVVVSDMLLKESTRLETAQIKDAIEALTGAIDGTYEDEAGAVKMAILKATKALS